MNMPASEPLSSPPKAARTRRARFAIALAVFAAWVLGLAAMAFRSEPPRDVAPRAGAERR